MCGAGQYSESDTIMISGDLPCDTCGTQVPGEIPTKFSYHSDVNKWGYPVDVYLVTGLVSCPGCGIRIGQVNVRCGSGELKYLVELPVHVMDLSGAVMGQMEGKE